MKERKTIIESAIRHLGPSGFDATSTLEISHEADGTKPLIYYLISHLVDLLKHTATVSQKINYVIYHHFQTVNYVPDRFRMLGEQFFWKIDIKR